MIAAIPSPGQQSIHQPFAVVVVEIQRMHTEAERVKPLRDLDRESFGVGVQSECHVNAPRGDAAGHAEPEKLDIVPSIELFEMARQRLPEASALVYPGEGASFARRSSIFSEVFELASQILPEVSALVYVGEGNSFAPRSSMSPEVVVTIKEELYQHDAVDNEVPCRKRHLCDGSVKQDDADEIRLQERVKMRTGPAATRRTPVDVRYPQVTTQRGIQDLSDFYG